jgi:hypothetical protein
MTHDEHHFHEPQQNGQLQSLYYADIKPVYLLKRSNMDL